LAWNLVAPALRGPLDSAHPIAPQLVPLHITNGNRVRSYLSGI